MRVFLAGASGVIGTRLVPLLIGGGHQVTGMTRSRAKAGMLADLGAEPVVCDVFDVGALTAAVVAAAPDLVMHQLTDLPDAVEEIPAFAARNNRIRTDGTRPLLAAARAAGGDRVPPPPRIHVDEPARATVELLDAPCGIVEIVEADG